ncbi:MAG: hypothetical protein ACXWC3_28905, partial [Burkholderiales bacterium]
AVSQGSVQENRMMRGFMFNGTRRLLLKGSMGAEPLCSAFFAQALSGEKHESLPWRPILLTH